MGVGADDVEAVELSEHSITVLVLVMMICAWQLAASCKATKIPNSFDIVGAMMPKFINLARSVKTQLRYLI